RCPAAVTDSVAASLLSVPTVGQANGDNKATPPSLACSSKATSGPRQGEQSGGGVRDWPERLSSHNGE
ncbi:hypothetical protein KUCAC02_020251, partial [Chaenocephalus aceratus]